MTVAEVFDWYDANEIRIYDPTAQHERLRVRGLFRAMFGGKDTDDCCPGDLLRFIASQRGAKSNWTRKRFNATINRPFNLAETMRVISRNPFKGVKIPEGPNGRDWTDAEFRAILRAAKPHFRRIVVYMKFGSARPGEGRLLTWPEVHEELEAVIHDKHKQSHTSKSPRRIYFNHVIFRLLIWLRRRARGPIVFPNAHGRQYTIKALSKQLLSIRRKIGLSEAVKCHGGRHTFATTALMNGVDLLELKDLMGHASVLTTQRYVHLVHKRGHLNRAANRAIGRGIKGCEA